MKNKIMIKEEEEEVEKGGAEKKTINMNSFFEQWIDPASNRSKSLQCSHTFRPPKEEAFGALFAALNR